MIKTLEVPVYETKGSPVYGYSDEVERPLVEVSGPSRLTTFSEGMTSNTFITVCGVKPSGEKIVHQVQNRSSFIGSQVTSALVFAQTLRTRFQVRH